MEPLNDNDSEPESLPVASEEEAKDSDECPTPILEDRQDQDMFDDTAANEMDNAPRNRISGLMAAIASIETSVIHITRSATARLDLFTSAPSKTVSFDEDSRRSFENLLNELRLARQQLSRTYEALGRALGQLSASNAHCKIIHRELGEVLRVQLENVTQKREVGWGVACGTG